MKTLIVTVGILGSALGLAMGADVLPHQAKPLSALLQLIEQAGVTQVKEAAFDDGVWEIEGLRDGNAVELHLNPISGAIISEHPDTQTRLPEPGTISAKAVAEFLERNSYSPILELEWEQSFWKAKAMHQNQLHKLKLARESEKILSDRLDD